MDKMVTMEMVEETETESMEEMETETVEEMETEMVEEMEMKIIMRMIELPGMLSNSHKRTIGTDAAFVMSWKELMKLMAKVYCPRTKIQKMESEL
ncbi:hypothetical protein Tco_1011185 [Tanacetum coccineum]